MPAPIVIAVDGPAGSGKSSVCRGVARELGLRYLDTGAMYRAMTLAVIDAGLDAGDANAVRGVLPSVSITSVTDPMTPAILLNGQNVTTQVRGEDVTAAVSAVSAIAEVRQALVTLQRSEVDRAAQDGSGIVVEGRDIGSVVLPDATVKIFLTADPQVRAERRAAETVGAEVGSTQAQLQARDAQDAGRQTSPMTQPADALVIDTTALSLAEVIEVVCAHVLHTQADSDGGNS
ncbi:MAG: (d)CMP kinase [Actinomycetales bacterium]